MSAEIVTERLALRPIDLDCVDALHSLWTEEPVRRFLWDGRRIPIHRTREIVETNRALFDEHGFGIWGVRERGCDELAGFSGYWHFRTPPSLELLFGVAAGHWNRGIATESSRRVIRYGFEKLGFSSIEASTDVANTASVRVLQKIGMSPTRREVVDGLETAFFELMRSDWRPEYELRPASEADFAFMQETKLTGLRRYVEAIWGWNREDQEARFRAVFDVENSRIVTVAGEDAGFIVLYEERSELFLAGIYLTKSHRGKGIGAAVIRGILERARQDRKSVRLHVLRPNPARRLYDRLGFVVTDESEAKFFMEWRP